MARWQARTSSVSSSSLGLADSSGQRLELRPRQRGRFLQSIEHTFENIGEH